MSGILNGVRVIDLARYIAGPYCGMLLADMGAEVIKVEKPGSGETTRTMGPFVDGVAIGYHTFNRNKKSVTADLRKPEGVEILKKLIASADVLLENFRAGTMEKMGLGYEEVKKINPNIIMVSVTGFGQGGPLRDHLAFDGIISAMSGVTRIEGDRVERSKGALHDHMAAMYATIGTLLALYDKKMTGKGQHVDVAMLASSTMIRSDSIATTSLKDEAYAMASDDGAPYGYIRAKDGWVNYNAAPSHMFKALLTLIDDPFLHEERFQDSQERIRHGNELNAAIEKWSLNMTCEETEEKFASVGIPSGTVATPGRLLNNKHLQERGYLTQIPVQELGKVATFMGFPILLSEHRDIAYNAAPTVGQNTEEVYHNVLGMTDEEIQALRDKGIV